jgi:uncharacterized protein (DUF433 family)
VKHYITTDPEIMSGQPCIVGTRIPVARVLFLIKQGYSLKEVQEDYPHVPMKVLEGVFSELAQLMDSKAYDSQNLQA